MNTKALPFCLVLSAGLLGGPMAFSATPNAPSSADVSAVYPASEALYLDLHQHPELSGHEVQTAAKLAENLRQLKFEVTTGLGGTGVVGVLKNGAGRTVLLRTEMDALPVLENTGLPYASKVTVTNASGVTLPVMQACGHDLHMSAWFGTAQWMSTHKNRWHGTLILVAQPAEELGEGAKAMISDGLLTRFGRPDYAIALHDTNMLPSGSLGYTAGYALAASDSLDITLYGRGGHGGRPQQTVDPIVMAARTVLALQTIVSRETNPIDPVVITVGSIHGGSKHNIVPDEVHLQLTVRTYKTEVRSQVLAAIERMTKAEAQAAGAPKEPVITLMPVAQATYNDPALTQRLAANLQNVLGKDQVVEVPPNTVSEDFAEFHAAGIPSAILWLGAVEPQKFKDLQSRHESAPELHSALWAPDYPNALRTGITAETAALLDLFAR